MLTDLINNALNCGASDAMCRIANTPEKLFIERFGNTVVLSDHTPDAAYREAAFSAAAAADCCLLYKWRHSKNFRERNGIILCGTPDNFIVENGIKYAVNLTLNQDNSFYGDTRNLRKFLFENSAGKRVLNTFAYTGSLGLAALASGAEKVVQTDLSGKFLALAERSVELNALAPEKMEIITGNFFPVVSNFKKSGINFDTVILDPPFFSQSSKGTVDLLNHPVSLVNKVRPVTADNGIIIMVNNALYLSGKDFLAAAEKLCDGKYLAIEKMIDIPEEFSTRTDSIADPAPFNHPTKIIVFRTHRKSAD